MIKKLTFTQAAAISCKIKKKNIYLLPTLFLLSHVAIKFIATTMINCIKRIFRAFSLSNYLHNYD